MYTVQEITKMLHLCASTVYQMCSNDTLKAAKNESGEWEIDPQSVYDYMRDCIKSQSKVGAFISPDDDIRAISFTTEDLALGVLLKETDKPYFASRSGRIFSVEGERFRELTPYINQSSKDKDNSYLRVQLMIDGARRSFFLHRLIAGAFCPNSRNAPEVHHLGAKSDNRADALLFCFSEEHQKLDRLKRKGSHEDYISYADEVRQLNSQPVKLPKVKLLYPYETSNNIIEYSIAVPVQAAIALSQGKAWDEVINLPETEATTEPMTQEELQEYIRKHPYNEHADVEYAFVLRRRKDTTEAKKEDAG
jgi:hypothetical protein